MQNSKTLYQFLQSTQGSWRNAFYVDCIECPYGRTDCRGHLLTANAEGAPLLLPILLFEKMTGDNSKLWLWILLASGSLTVLITVSIVSRKKRKAL